MKMMWAGFAAGALIPATLFAQTAAPPPMGAPRHEMKPITRAELTAMVAQHFAALDLNHDGKLTREEIRAFREGEMEKRIKEHKDREFARLDSNHDGSISKAEFDVAPIGHGPGDPGMMPPPPPGGPGPMVHGRMGMGPMGGPGSHMGMMMMGGRWFDKADANHDGAVTLAEAQTAAAALFDKLDTNHDGVISPDEMRAAFAGRGGWGGHRGPGSPGGDMPPPPPPPAE